ncbi:MAG: TolC family protein [Cyclobacteriaceae bacterium]|nr:TolC family protein [Cyclobacteriaceae bacterium]
MMKYIIVSIVFLWIAGVVEAQETLSISSAIQIGLENNFDIAIENKNIEINENNDTWGEAGKWPSITLNLGQNNSLTNNIKTASPFQLQGEILNNSLNPAVNVNWTLFNGFKVRMSKDRLDQLVEESYGNAEIVVSNTIQAIILGYYRAVLEKERLHEFKMQLTFSKDKYEYVKIRSDLGSSGTSDRLLEENNYLTDSIDFMNQELFYRQALRNLNLILGESDPDKEYEFTDKLSVDIPEYNIENLLSKMETDNVNLKKQYISESIIKYETYIRKADRYPSVMFNGGYSLNTSRVDLSNAFFPQQDGTSRSGPVDPLSAVSSTLFGNFTIAFTLFNGGKINRAIQNSIVREDIANLSTQKMKLYLRSDLKDAFDQFENRKLIYAIIERKQEVAMKNFEIVSEKFKSGTINSFDFRVVQNNYLMASMQRLSALYNLLDAHVSLMRLTGGIIETYNN